MLFERNGKRQFSPAVMQRRPVVTGVICTVPAVVSVIGGGGGGGGRLELPQQGDDDGRAGSRCPLQPSGSGLEPLLRRRRQLQVSTDQAGRSDLACWCG